MKVWIAVDLKTITALPSSGMHSEFFCFASSVAMETLIYNRFYMRHGEPSLQSLHQLFPYHS